MTNHAERQVLRNIIILGGTVARAQLDPEDCAYLSELSTKGLLCDGSEYMLLSDGSRQLIEPRRWKITDPGRAAAAQV